MFMIVLNHMMCHGVMHAFDQSTRNLIWIKGSVFNKVCSSLLAVGGNKGVAVFFIITGYFMIKDPRVRLKKVVLETVFYGLLFSCLALVFIFCGYSFPGIKTSSFLINLVRSCMIPVSSGLWWFISAYILLILFHPLVNTFASKLSKDGFLAFLIFYYIIWYSIGIFCKAPFLYLQKGIFFYLVGGFIRLNYSTETMQNIKDKVSDNSRGGRRSFFVCSL